MPNMHNLYTLTISKHWNVTTTLKTCPNTDFSKQKHLYYQESKHLLEQDSEKKFKISKL